MEACSAYRSWHDNASGKTLFKSTAGKCLHYNFYFIDEQLAGQRSRFLLVGLGMPQAQRERVRRPNDVPQQHFAPNRSAFSQN